MYLYIFKHNVFTQLEGELYLAPGFPLPPNSDYNGYHAYIDECLPPESPYLYGLHPNAEIEFLTTNSDALFKTVLEMQPRDASSGGGTGATKDERIKVTCFGSVSIVGICLHASQVGAVCWRKGGVLSPPKHFTLDYRIVVIFAGDT